MNPRLLALRLACLNDLDRQWIYARLAPAEVNRIKVLLADLQQRGLLRVPSVMRQLLAEPPEAAVELPESPLARLLEQLDTPAWKALVIQYLEEPDRERARERYFANNPLLYRQLASALEAQPLPPGWRSALVSLAATSAGKAAVQEA